MALLPLLLTAAVLCLHCPSQVEGVIPACADASGMSMRLRCVNWQMNSTGGCTTTFTSSSFVPSIEGATYVYSPGFVGESKYANNAACTWLVPRTDECSSLQFILVVKDLAHNEQDGQNCANNDHLDLDNGEQLYCDGAERDNCPFNNCPSVTYTSDASSMEITFRSDGSNFGSGVFGVVFEVPIANCATRRKRTVQWDNGKVVLPYYCSKHYYSQHHRYRRTYKYHYKPPPCECFGNCTAEGVDNLRAIAQKIVMDRTGKKALKYINSENDFLRGVARLAWQNIESFNMTVPPYEVINDANCIAPPQQTFTVPKFTVKPWTPPTHKPHPWTRPTHKPHPWTQPTHKPYPWTQPTYRRQPWNRYSTRRPYYHSTSRPRYVPYPQPKSWSPW